MVAVAAKPQLNDKLYVFIANTHMDATIFELEKFWTLHCHPNKIPIKPMFSIFCLAPPTPRHLETNTLLLVYYYITFSNKIK